MPPSPVGGIDRLLGGPAAVADAQAPLPPGYVGEGAPPPREKRRGFFRRLFGG
jgi:hypothetical protein